MAIPVIKFSFGWQVLRDVTVFCNTRSDISSSYSSGCSFIGTLFVYVMMEYIFMTIKYTSSCSFIGTTFIYVMTKNISMTITYPK